MTPVEIFKGEVDPKMLRRLYGKRVFGVVSYSLSEEKEDRLKFEEIVERLQPELVKKLTESFPKGFYTSRLSQVVWEQTIESDVNVFGEHAIACLFPKEGHRNYVRFRGALRRNGINTVEDLVQKGRGKLRQIGSTGSMRDAVGLIIAHFEPLVVLQD